MCKSPEVPRTGMVPHCSYNKIRTPEQACKATLPLAPACVSSITAPNFSFPFSCFSAPQILFLLLKHAQLFLPLCLCVFSSLCLECLSLSSFLTHQILTQGHLLEEAFLGHLIGRLQYSAISTPVYFCLAN